MNFIEALILGIIQGLTEFLPVSSSGHIELGAVLLNVQSKDNLLFSIIVHGATALSTIVVFRKTIIQIIVELLEFKWNESTQFITKIIISMIPVGIAGVFFEKQIESFFGGNVIFVASMLLVTGLLLTFTYFTNSQKKDVNYWKALIIGLAQAIAILPGISRSGATISTAILLGVDKEKATKFSFLMVLPPILGAMLLKIKDLIEQPELINNISFPVLSVGFIAAFISGVIACSWMVNIVKRGKLIYFAIYCIIVGLSVIIFS
ncbi:MAG: undecaprenyl-diphosphate phosphatase [Cyclobacteriaceae bacterium]|nr:undecaprenyl-diphosphate phosphatase [Cyclobacteriaceae bacterium]